MVVLGLILNTFGSILVLYPFLNTNRSVDDDVIVKMDGSSYTQRRHLKDRKIGLWGAVLFIAGFIFQIIGIIAV